MNRWLRRFFAIACVAVAAACSGTEPGQPRGQQAEQVASVAQALTTTTVTITLPATGTPQNTILSATGALNIASGSAVGTATQHYEVANFGAQTTFAVPGILISGNVTSIPPVVIAPGADITGTVKSAGSITQLVGSFVGNSVPNTTIGQVPFSWSVTIPSTNAGAVNVGLLQTVSLAPGAYSDVTVLPSGTLSLTSGTYYFTSLNVLAGSAVRLNEAAGPVQVYVTGAVSVAGGLAPSGGTGNNFLLVSLGTGLANFSSPIAGSIVAPNGGVNLNPTLLPHVGQVFAKQISLFFGTRINLGSFDWGYFCPLGDSDRDGVSDCQDGCPFDPEKTTPGVCDCGTADTDTDGDGVPDCIDQCPNDPTKAVVGQCGCAGSPRRRAPRAPTASARAPAAPTRWRATAPGSAATPMPARPPGQLHAEAGGDRIYWVCSGAAWTQAEANCSATPGPVASRESTAASRTLSSRAWSRVPRGSAATTGRPPGRGAGPRARARTAPSSTRAAPRSAASSTTGPPARRATPRAPAPPSGRQRDVVRSDSARRPCRTCAARARSR